MHVTLVMVTRVTITSYGGNNNDLVSPQRNGEEGHSECETKLKISVILKISFYHIQYYC